MFVDSSVTRLNGKDYQRHLLRETYREDGKVKHRTLANLTHCKPEEVEAIRLALRHKGDLPRILASAVEFILEGLYVNNKLNKTSSGGKNIYRN